MGSQSHTKARAAVTPRDTTVRERQVYFYLTKYEMYKNVSWLIGRNLVLIGTSLAFLAANEQQMLNLDTEPSMTMVGIYPVTTDYFD